jgi:hypothetical protein
LVSPNANFRTARTLRVARARSRAALVG